MNMKPIHIDPVLLKQLDQKQKQIDEYLLSCDRHNTYFLDIILKNNFGK